MATRKTDKPTLPPGFELPPGYVLQRVGGRPRRENRDMAVLSAWKWREACGDIPASAERWILERWRLNGLSEGAHVRAAKRKALARGPEFSLWFITHFGGVAAIELAGYSDGNPVYFTRARVWIWYPDWTEAKIYTMVINIESDQSGGAKLNISRELFEPT